MSYSNKLTDYALLPTGGFPLDTRSHFENFAVAHNTINGNTVTTVEQTPENNYKKIYYANQIITTTYCGIWRVTQTPNTVTLYFSSTLAENTKGQVGWNTTLWDSNAIPGFYIVVNKDGTGSTTYTLYCKNINDTGVDTRGDIIQVFDEADTEVYQGNRKVTLSGTYLLPFNESSGGGTAGIADVKVNGASVVDESLVANINMPKMTITTDGSTAEIQNINFTLNGTELTIDVNNSNN